MKFSMAYDDKDFKEVVADFAAGELPCLSLPLAARGDGTDW